MANELVAKFGYNTPSSTGAATATDPDKCNIQSPMPTKEQVMGVKTIQRFAPLRNPAEGQTASEITEGIVFARAWIAGAQFGWNCGQENAEDRFQTALASGYRNIREARSAALNEATPDHSLDQVRERRSSRDAGLGYYERR